MSKKQISKTHKAEADKIVRNIKFNFPKSMLSISIHKEGAIPSGERAYDSKG
jgi:hypothetical protein